MLKIGCVTIDTSHPLGIAEKLEANGMDMRYEYLWDKCFRKPEEREWFVKRFGLKGEVDEIKDMVDKVDVGFIHSCDWEEHLDHAMPFIEAGKPVFIDKPLVGSVKDIARTRELVAKGAKIVGASSVRYAEEIQSFLNEPVEERGEVIAVMGTVGNNEFDYAIHVVEGMSELAGAKAKSAKYIGRGKTVDNISCEMYSIEFENGVRGVYTSKLGKPCPFIFTIITTKKPRFFQIANGKIMKALMDEIYSELSTGKSILTDVETLLNCSEIMLCCKKSRDELNGAEVTIDMLTEDDKYDGRAFKAAYGANAGISYKDKD